MQNISIPTQEIIFIAIPIFSPAMLETIPMIHGIRMPPKLAAGSKITDAGYAGHLSGTGNGSWVHAGHGKRQRRKAGE